jgi:hypothetical protein
MILVVIDGLRPFSVTIWEPLNGNQIIAQLCNVD